MTSNCAFNHFTNSVFGDGFINLDETVADSNNIIGAIRRFYENGDYSFFASNMKRRLQNLKVTYQSKSIDLKNIQNKLVNLATNNWQGYYAELVAYEYFNQFTYVETEIGNIDKNLTLAQFAGKSRTCSSFDGRLPGYSNLTFEVKSFNDNIKNIFSNITDKAMLSYPDIKDITFNYPQDYDYTLVQDNIGLLLKDLGSCCSTKATYLSPTYLPRITVNVFYTKQRVLTSEHSYSPYRHAEQNKYFVLNHFDQLFINENNLLVYVIHPWMNLVINDFSGKRKFLRSFCRRVFCELVKDTRELRQVMPNKWPNVTLPVNEIIKHIGGILFIFDNNVESHKNYDTRNPMTIIEPFFYTNPNAYHKNKNIVFTDLLSNSSFAHSLIVYDDFENDNY